MRQMLRLFLFGLLLASSLLWSSIVRAEAESGAVPRDVTVQSGMAGVRLPPAPDGFEHLSGGFIVLEAPSSVHDRVAPLLRESEEFRARLSEDLGQPVLDHVVVRVARSPDEMVELAPEGQGVPPYAAGVAYLPARVIVLTLREPLTWEAPDLSTLLRHELTHVALADAVSDHPVPRWFNEGFAIRESGEVSWARTRTLWEASLNRTLVPLEGLDDGFPSGRYEVNVAYAESADVVNFLMRDTDRARFGSLVERVRSGSDFVRSLEDAYGTDVRKLEYEWRESLGHRFGLFPILTGGGLLWTLIIALAGAAWFKRRLRANAKLAQWAREEAEMDRVGPTPVAPANPSGDDDLPARVPSLPVVEHEGRWYTVH
jgi:hypothetical protein